MENFAQGSLPFFEKYACSVSYAAFPFQSADPRNRHRRSIGFASGTHGLLEETRLGCS